MGTRSMVSVPFAQAMRINQSSGMGATRHRATEIIYDLVISPATEVGTLWTLEFNPPTLGNTRLAALSQSYQQYKVRGLMATLFTNLPTTASGTFVFGSTANPDQTIKNGQQVFALPGASMVSMFTPSTAKLNFSNEWLNIDPDSIEKMKTTACKFVVCLQSKPNITGTDMHIPVYIEWDVEFRYPAVQEPQEEPTQAVIVPACHMTSVDAGGAVYLASETSVPLPILKERVVYAIEPSWDVLSEVGASVTIVAITQGPQAGGRSYFMYDSVAAANSGTNIKVQFSSSLILPYTTAEPLNA